VDLSNSIDVANWLVIYFDVRRLSSVRVGRLGFWSVVGARFANGRGLILSKPTPFRGASITNCFFYSSSMLLSS